MSARPPRRRRGEQSTRGASGLFAMSARNPLRRPRLGTLLVGINVGLLLLAIAIVTFMAVSLLQQLADDQAHVRVTQAGSSAHQAVLLAGAEIASDAQLLGEQLGVA